MTKEQLFEKYSIDESHNTWDNGIDNWMSVEVYRVMHDGKLPPENDLSVMWVCEFLDKIHDDSKFMNKMMLRNDWSSLYLTSKRMVYSFQKEILKHTK